MDTVFESTDFVPYLVQVVLLTCTAKISTWLIANGHTAVRFLPIRIGSDLKDSCSVHEWGPLYIFYRRS